MAMFTARISKGRTIRAVILGMCGGGTLGCALAFTVFGNTSLYYELTRILPVVDIMTNQGAPAAIIAMVKSMPLGTALVSCIYYTCVYFFGNDNRLSSLYTVFYVVKSNYRNARTCKMDSLVLGNTYRFCLNHHDVRGGDWPLYKRYLRSRASRLCLSW